MPRIDKTKFIGVVPGYEEIHGRTATLDDLKAIIRKYSAFEWLSFLARIQSVLSADRIHDVELQRHVFHGVFSKRLQAAIAAWATERDVVASSAPCYERQLSTLQQLVILHAPETSDSMINGEAGFDNLGSAILMTLDLMSPNVVDSSRRDDVIANLIQAQVRMSTTPLRRYAARAVAFYALDSEVPNTAIVNYLRLFELSTGVSGRDYVMGGLLYAILEWARSPNEHATNWQACQQIDPFEQGLLHRCTSAFSQVRSGSLEQIRAEIIRLETDPNVGDWHLIGLYKFPLIRFPPKGMFVANLDSLGRSLFDGIRHVVLTAALDGKLPQPYTTADSVGSIFGEVFLQYVERVLHVAFPDRVIRVPECKRAGHHRADFLVLFPGKVLIVEAKGRAFRAKDHAKWMPISARREEVKSTGIQKAVTQMIATIRAIRSFEFDEPRLRAYDWTTATVVPLVVTHDEFPLVPLSWESLYADENARLHELNGVGPIAPLRFLSIGDLERAPDVRSVEDFATLLLKWGDDKDTRELMFSQFLSQGGHNATREFMHDQFDRAMQLFKQRFGLSVHNDK